MNEGRVSEIKAPTIGRIVLYVIGKECSLSVAPAIVTEVVLDETVTLTVFMPDSSEIHYFVRHDENKAIGTWHWPPRV